jgi:hypothetical protein
VYTVAINELEQWVIQLKFHPTPFAGLSITRTLLNFSAVAAEESALWVPDVTVNTIGDCIKFASIWSRNRGHLLDYFNRLHSAGALQVCVFGV